MKTLFKSLKITLAFCVFFSVFYILILWIFAQAAGPNKGNAEVATLDGKVVGAANVGQMFTKDIYFWGRPSHAGDGYDATSSSGSNKGPTNEEYLSEVEARIDTFLVHHPYLNRKDVPAEMLKPSALAHSGKTFMMEEPPVVTPIKYMVGCVAFSSFILLPPYLATVIFPRRCFRTSPRSDFL